MSSMPRCGWHHASPLGLLHCAVSLYVLEQGCFISFIVPSGLPPILTNRTHVSVQENSPDNDLLRPAFRSQAPRVISLA